MLLCPAAFLCAPSLAAARAGRLFPMMPDRVSLSARCDLPGLSDLPHVRVFLL